MRLIYSVIIFALFLSSCASMRMRYEADVEDGQNKSGHFTYEKTYSTTGSAVGCWLTAIFYGGWCWAYLAKPFGSEIEILTAEAQGELRNKYDYAHIVLKSESILRMNWQLGSTTSNYLPYQKSIGKTD